MRKEKVFTVYNSTLMHIAEQAYRMGLADAPSIMGRRGRETQLKGGRMTSSENYISIRKPWENVILETSERIEFELTGNPATEL